MSGADVHVQDRVTEMQVFAVGNTSINAAAELGVFTDFTRETLLKCHLSKEKHEHVGESSFHTQNQEWVAELSSEAPNPQGIVIKCTQ